jgi:hypothetical protein
MILMIPGERLSLQRAISYDAAFNCLLDPMAKGALRCKTRNGESVNLKIWELISIVLSTLVTGVFWGPWVALSRSISTFALEAFLAIVDRLSRNIAPVMTVLMPAALWSMVLVLFLSFSEDRGPSI